MKPQLGLIAIALLLSLAGTSAAGQDWSSCSSDLDSLRRRARDAASEASTMDDRKRDLESKRSYLRSCMQNRSGGDECESERSDVNAAVSVSTVRSSLDEVDSKIRSVSTSCAVDLKRANGSSPLLPVPAGVDPAMCRVYLDYKVRLPIANLLEACAKQNSMAQCKRCLSVQ